jgi:hypothetical protein
MLCYRAKDDRVIDTVRVLHASHPDVSLIILLDSYDRARAHFFLSEIRRSTFVSSSSRLTFLR